MPNETDRNPTNPPIKKFFSRFLSKETIELIRSLCHKQKRETINITINTSDNPKRINRMGVVCVKEISRNGAENLSIINKKMPIPMLNTNLDFIFYLFFEINTS